ncbi:MAG: hypothetical protein K2X47_03730 [Bdellovibrionales bacterium]|nr:hypothetical protein [Bdellovibrionales bacterium]
MKNMIVLTFFLFSVTAYSHGEDKPGPHGGFIRMPGAFHTEVLVQGQNQVRIYLLDIEWKNPSVKSSSVKAKIMGKKQFPAECKVQDEFYLCSFGKGAKLNSGQLVIEAQREGQQGNPISYDLPLRLGGSSHGSN